MAYDLYALKRGVSKHLSYYIGPPSPISISRTVFYTGFDDKRDFFFTTFRLPYFCLPLAGTLLMLKKMSQWKKGAV